MKLTPKQMWVMQQIVDSGANIKTIAWKHKLSPSTIGTHCRRAAQRLGATSTLQAVAFFERARLKGEL